MSKKQFTVTEAASKAGCTVSYVRRLLRSGSISGNKVGSWLWLLEESEIKKLKKSLGIRSSGKKLLQK
jgi:excisionase family DNA binding protein